MTSKLTSLEAVLTDPSQRPLDCCLYLDFEVVWDLSTRAAVLGDSDIDGVPQFALDNGLSYVLGTNELIDIIENAREQIREPSPGQLLEAFLYYYDHDALIEF